jgi:hypothetical protein
MLAAFVEESRIPDNLSGGTFLGDAVYLLAPKLGRIFQPAEYFKGPFLGVISWRIFCEQALHLEAGGPECFRELMRHVLAHVAELGVGIFSAGDCVFRVDPAEAFCRVITITAVTGASKLGGFMVKAERGAPPRASTETTWSVWCGLT